MLRINGKEYSLEHGFAFKLKVPDMEAMTPADFEKGREGMKWLLSSAVSLSDKPFDVPALSKLADPTEALDLMAVNGGAAVVTAIAGTGGKVSALRVAFDGNILMPDAAFATLTLQPVKDGKVSGKLVVIGDRQSHEFDPKNIPLIEVDADFVAPAP